MDQRNQKVEWNKNKTQTNKNKIKTKQNTSELVAFKTLVGEILQH